MVELCYYEVAFGYHPTFQDVAEQPSNAHSLCVLTHSRLQLPSPPPSPVTMDDEATQTPLSAFFQMKNHE